MDSTEDPEYVSKKKSGYQKAYDEKGGIKSLQWKNYSSAASRYIQLIDESIDFNNKKILDVGCGFGDIIPYIFNRTGKNNFQYHGLDLMGVFTNEASLRYPEFTFSNDNLFTENKFDKDAFDIVISSGILNANSFENEEEIILYRKNAIKRMFDVAKEALAVNMAGGINIPNTKDAKIYYINSKIIIDFCSELTPKFIIKHHYHTKDFTIILFK